MVSDRNWMRAFCQETIIDDLAMSIIGVYKAFHSTICGSLKEAVFHFKIVIHTTVKIQMITAEICKNIKVKIYPIYSMKSEGMGRDFHDHMAYACLYHLHQDLIELQDIRGRVFCGIIPSEDFIAQSPDPSCIETLIYKHLIDHQGAGCFPVCTRDAI